MLMLMMMGFSQICLLSHPLISSFLSAFFPRKLVSHDNCKEGKKNIKYII